EGTFDYCAPEQRFGLPTDERSDLFSLAVMAYELLTGQLPGRVFASARNANARLAPGVDEVLRRALARDPSERYASIEQFRHELTVHLGRPVRRRRRRRLPLIACAVILLCASLVLLFHARNRAASNDAELQSWL